MNLHLAGGFDERKIEEIVGGAIRVLEKTGVVLEHEKALKMLSDIKGIKVKNKKVLFSEEICREYLEKYKKDERNRSHHKQFKLEGPWSAFYFLDPKTQDIRPATKEDLRYSLRLLEGMDIYRNVAPLQATDLPKEIKTVTECKIVIENAPRTGMSPLTNKQDIETVYEMCQVVGRKPPIWSTEITISPLRLNPEAIDLVLEFLDKEMVIEGEPGPMISAGSTGPLQCPAFFIQGLAEWLGGYIVLQSLSGGKLGNNPDFATVFNGGLRFEPIHFDMKYASPAFGSAESVILRFLTRQIFRYLGGDPTIGGSMRTTSKSIDAQCIAERSMNCLIEALDGVKVYVGAGMLSIDEAFSPELAVIDSEIIKYVKRVTEGIEYTEGIDEAVELILRVSPQGIYLMDRTTVENFRKYFWDPTIFEHTTFAQWNQKGRPALREKVRQKMDEVIKSYSFKLDEKKQKEIDRIYHSYLRKKRVC